MENPKVSGRTTPGFAFSLVDRAILDCLSLRKFGQPEIQAVINFFERDPIECVFCGSLNVTRWDHLIPVKNGGETVLGNMVPACSRCDDSKGGLLFFEWMNGSSPRSPGRNGVKDVDLRTQKIRDYMEHFGYRPRDLSDRLAPEEIERLITVRSRLAEARSDLDRLIQEYRERNGYR